MASLFCISSLQLESFPLLLRTHEMIMSKLQRRLTALAFGCAGSRTSFQFKAHFLQLPQQQALRRIKTETLETSPSLLMLQRAQRKPVCCQCYWWARKPEQNQSEWGGEAAARGEDGCLLCVKLDEVRVDWSLVCSCGGARDHSYTPVPRGRLLVLVSVGANSIFSHRLV